MVGRSGYILLYFIVVCIMVSCSGYSDRQGLVALDSLILQDPDSACELLAAYPADSLPTADDRAYHALLTTIADYKAYRPATTDSVINIAVNHYDHNGANEDKRMRSLLYKGCVMEELGDPEQAIEYYKRAEIVCPTEDYFHNGYINLRKASLYHLSFSDSISLDVYAKAIRYFHMVNERHYESLCLNSMGMLYSHLGNYDLAKLKILQAISIAEESSDSINMCVGYNNLSFLYYERHKYCDVLNTSKKLIKLGESFPLNQTCYNIISISFAKLGRPDSAEIFLNLAPKPIQIEDSISRWRAIAELAYARGDLKTYAYNNDIAINKSDSVLLASQADKIRQSENKYDMAMKDIKLLTRQRQLVFIIGLLLIIIIVVVFCIFIYRRREKYTRMELEEAISQISASRLQLEQVLHENKNRLNELKAQEEQLHHMQLLLKQMRNTHNGDKEHIKEQLGKTNQALNEADLSMKIQDQTLICLDEILRTVFYSGRYNSDQIIDNDSVINMKPEFWTNLYKLVSLKHDNIYSRIEAKGIVLNENEKKLIALSAANLPRAIIRRILDLKNIQVVSNRRQKLAKKIIGKYSNFEEIFN